MSEDVAQQKTDMLFAPEEKNKGIETNTSSTRAKYTRRDFLKLASAASLGILGYRYGVPLIREVEEIGVGIMDSVEQPVVDVEKLSWNEFDFVAKPEQLKGKELREKMVDDLNDWGDFVNELWKIEQSGSGQETKNYVDSESWNLSSNSLVSETFRLANLLHLSRERGLRNVSVEVSRKYQEYASYLRMSLLASTYLRTLSADEAYTLVSNFGEENISMLKIGSDVMDLAMPEGFKRLQIDALWNYPWKDLVEGRSSGLHKVMSQVVSSKGEPFVDVPKWSTSNLLPERERDIDIDQFSFGGKPEKAPIINVDPEVNKILSRKLSKVGIERGMRTFSWQNHDSFPQGHTSPEGDVYVGGGVYTLDLETYQKYSKVYDALALHEANHALEGRSQMLRGVDRLEYREHMLNIFRRFDPLREIKSIFNPDGIYPDFSQFANELDYRLAEKNKPEYIHTTDYYIQILLGMVYGTSVKQYMDELRGGLAIMSGKDVYDDLWPRDVNSSEEYFQVLEDKRDGYEGLSRLIVDTMLTSKNDILMSKRGVFASAPGLIYITDVVLPLVFAHTAQYRKDEMEKSFLVDANSDVGKSYFRNWQMRFADFIMTIPCEELVGEVVSTMLIDSRSGADKEWQETLSDYKRMLFLLKRNGLAYNKNSDLV